jgi:hypothetical protein
MRDQDRPPAPDDLPRSPSGRVPQWVVDASRGSVPQDTGWRAAPAGAGDPPTRGARRRWTRVLLVGAVVAALVGVTVVVVRSPSLRAKIDGAGAASAADRPPSGLEEGARPRTAWPQPEPAAADGSAAYLDTQPGSTLPVTWSPCRPIHYVVDTAGMSVDGLGILQSAVAELSRATGIRFVDDGTTSETPSAGRSPYQPDRYGDRWAPVLISWVGHRQDPEMTADVLGMTRPDRVAVDPSDRTSPLVYVSGQVEMNADLIGTIQRRLGVKATRSVFLHELGHLVGLGHVPSTSAVMNPVYQPKVVTFTSGELTALQSLGSGPCRPEV